MVTSRALLLMIGMLLTAAWSVCYAADIDPLGKSPNFTRLLMDSTPTVGEVQALRQDSKGFMWIGGKTGLARYDGYRFKVFVSNSKDEHSLSASFIRDIFEDSTGQLWVSTDGGGVMKYNSAFENFERIGYTAESMAAEVESGGQDRKFEVIYRIYEDSHHNLWFAGNFGVGRYDREQNKIVQELPNSKLKMYLINGIAQVGENDYLITASTGAYYWRRSEGKGEVILHQDGNPASLATSILREVLVDSYRNIWVAHDKGISRFRPETRDFENFVIQNSNPGLSGTPVWSLFEDNKRMLWLSTDGNGLMYFDPLTRKLGAYTSSASYASLSKSVVRRAYQDRAGDYWVGMFPVGVSYYDASNNSFTLYNNFMRNRDGQFRNQVWAFQEDEHENLWLGVDDLGLVYFDRAKSRFSQSYQGLDFSNLGFPRTVLSVFIDSHDNLWFGAWAEGIGRINLRTKQYELFKTPKNGVANTVFPAKHVWQIMEAKNGTIYFGTSSNGFVTYDYRNGEFTNHKRDLNAVGDKVLRSDNVWHLHEDEQGSIWMGTSSGIAIYDPVTGRFKMISPDQKGEDGLSHYWVTSFLKDSKGRLWISTMGGGINLWNPKTETFKHYRAEDGLGSDGIQGMLEDEKGLLWVSTRIGLTLFDPENETFTRYTDKNWLQNGEFNTGAYARLRSGELALGGVNGFNVFDPKKVTKNNYVPPIYFTEFELFDKAMTASAPNSPLSKSIIDTGEIILNHDQDVFTLSFSALSYRAYADNQYRYILEGFDTDWREATTINRVTYTHLDAGSYTFRVRGSNNAGVWNPDERSVVIIVRPALWRTWWAYVLYTMAILSIVGWYLHIQRTKIKQAALVNSKLKELDRLKANFMANTSHELRTPVNGILGMAVALRDSDDVGECLSVAAKEKVDVIFSCGRRLARLVNDILDFSAISESQLLLKRGCVDLSKMLPEVIAECHIQHANGSIKIENLLNADLPLVYVDEARSFTVFYNIVSNAFKFTEKGFVRIAAVVTDSEISIRISDTGMGIEKQDMDRIFSSFLQVANSGVNQQNGTGLGMAISKYLVEQHGGKLTVESTRGVGSVFTVSLPRATTEQVAQYHLGLSPALRRSSSVESRQDRTLDVGLQVFYPKSFTAEAQHEFLRVLVADDERVNRMVLRHMLLKHNCVVYEAANGQEVVDVFDQGFACDMLLLDIMMPKLSGIEACIHIRQSWSAEDLPVIFVTAKTQQQDREDCIAAGGNDFLTKPITNDVLYAHMDVLIRLKNKASAA